MSRALLATLGFSLVLAGRGAAAPPVPSAGKEAPAATPETPESAFKAFFLAMATGDEPALRRLTLPAPDLDVLLKGRHVAPDRVAAFRKSVLDPMRVKRLRPGDEVTLPGGRVYTVRPEHVTADRAVLLPEGWPIPTDVLRVKGGWVVDARAVIAGRRAAEAARERAGGPAAKPKG